MEKSLEMAAFYVKGGCDAIEWSFPPEDPYMDPEYIAEKMLAAREGCGDYNVYLDKLAEFKAAYPVEIYPLLYQETILDITPARLLDFCLKNGIGTIISADLSNERAKSVLMEGGLRLASAVSYAMMPRELETALSCNGFVYMQAMPTREDIEAGRGRETLKRCIRKLRGIGVDRPVYCGVGIRDLDDIRFIMDSGGNGLFLGSAVMRHYDNPEKLMWTVSEYKRTAALLAAEKR